ELLAGGSVEKLEGNRASGYYLQPTLLKGHNGMRVFQEEICGPVVGVTTVKEEAEAVLGVVGDGQGLGFVLEDGDANNQAENSLLEHTHDIVPLEQGRLGGV
ncbi:aldehyde dehydrogenase family protein, partial [Pseudomonas aeruginosa]